MISRLIPSTNTTSWPTSDQISCAVQEKLSGEPGGRVRRRSPWSGGQLRPERALGQVDDRQHCHSLLSQPQHPHPSCQHCPTGRDIVDWILLDQENFQKSPVNWSTYSLICIKSVGIFSRAYSESKLWCNDFFVQCPLALIPLWAFPVHHKTISGLYYGGDMEKKSWRQNVSLLQPWLFKGRLLNSIYYLWSRLPEY